VRGVCRPTKNKFVLPDFRILILIVTPLKLSFKAKLITITIKVSRMSPISPKIICFLYPTFYSPFLEETLLTQKFEAQTTKSLKEAVFGMFG